MSFAYTNSLSDYSPGFPASVFTPIEVRNRDDDGYAIVGESFTVPASSPYRVNLDQVIQEQASVTITVDGGARTVIPYGETPSAGEVAISAEMGVMEFHSSDAGLTGSASYTGRGTPLQAYIFHALQEELEAVQDWLLNGDLVDAIEANLSGIDGTSFTIDKDNAGAGSASIALAFNRGTDGLDATLTWNESSDSFGFQYAGSGSPVNVSMGNISAVSATLTGALTGVSADFSGAVEADSFGINGTQVIADDLSANLGDISCTGLQSSGTITGASAALTGDLTTGGRLGVNVVSPSYDIDVEASGSSLLHIADIDSNPVIRATGDIDSNTNLLISIGDVDEVIGSMRIDMNLATQTIDLVGVNINAKGNLNLNDTTGRRINLRAWTGTAGQEGRIVFNANGDADTFIGHGPGGGDALVMYAGGSDIFYITPYDIVARKRILSNIGGGSAASPAYTDSGHTSGIYFSAVGKLDFSSNDTRAGGFDASQNFDVVGNVTIGGDLIAPSTTPPATASSTGTAGQIAIDSGYIYYCYATDTWVRAALATW